MQAANAFLKAVSATIQPGDFLDRSPADIGRDAGLPSPLAVARAVRALAARRRLEVEDGRYRLLDPRPLDPGEPESVPRAPRKRRARRKSAARGVEAPVGERRATYADLGRAVVERIIELGRDSAEAISAADHLRRDSKDNKAARIEAEQRASRLFERVKELEVKLEMAEANLRTVLAAARGRGATATPSDTEMEALLRILKAPGEGEEEATREDGSREDGSREDGSRDTGSRDEEPGEDGRAEVAEAAGPAQLAPEAVEEAAGE